MGVAPTGQDREKPYATAHVGPLLGLRQWLWKPYVRESMWYQEAFQKVWGFRPVAVGLRVVFSVPGYMAKIGCSQTECYN